MFRLLTSTGSLRPVLLRNVANSLKTSNPSLELEKNLEKNFQFRANSTSPIAKAEVYFAKAAADPLLKDVVPASASRFEELLSAASDKVPRNSGPRATHFDTVRELSAMFKDDAVKDSLSGKDIWQYAVLLNNSVYKNRLSRLSRNSNRDSDQYRNSTLHNDVLLKNAILDLADNVARGSFSAVVDPATLRILLLAMLQFKVYPEMLRLWENGVNDPKSSRVYLKQNVLALILPLAYDEKRFSYDQILKLYEVNTKDSVVVFHELLTSMGKIAIKSGDYARGLDCLESLLQIFEDQHQKKYLLKSLAELHMSFIGSCKDIKIAKHFFDKVVGNQLPYQVMLKAPHVQSLLENCVEMQEPFEDIQALWRATVEFYAADKLDSGVLNSRFSILNNSFLAIFFNAYPQLTEESYAKLKEIISTYAAVKAIDEYFLNTIVSNYCWGDKVVFEQLLDNYHVHQVKCTPVVNRVALKKMGSIADFSRSDILAAWNKTLADLDAQGYNYIPIADWAALRDATILSDFPERKALYMSLLDTYKNFHQDERAVERFVRYWLNKPQVDDIAQISFGTYRHADEERVEVPPFEKLRENVDYGAVSAPRFHKH